MAWLDDSENWNGDYFITEGKLVYPPGQPQKKEPDETGDSDRCPDAEKGCIVQKAEAPLNRQQTNTDGHITPKARSRHTRP